MIQIKLRVAPLTRAAAEGRDLAMNKAANKRFAADDTDSEAGQGEHIAWTVQLCTCTNEL
jgi:hypothetical protein